MTLPIDTQTIVSMYLDEMLTQQQIADRLGCTQQLVWARLKKAGVTLRKSLQHLKPHLPVLRSMLDEMRKRRRKMAEFVVDPRNPNRERAAMAERLVILNREIAAMEIVTQ